METINHEYYVSLEVAKLLKECGFKWLINTTYRDGVLVYQKNSLCDNFNGKRYENSTVYEFFSAPTLEVAQRWLREIKNISVDISSTCYSEWKYIIRKINQLNHKDNTILALTACGFYTYEEAQEAGIKKALEIILEKGE